MKDCKFQEFEQSLGVSGCLAYRIPVAATYPHCPSHTHISVTPDITAMPVIASQNQAGQTINDD